MLVKIANKQLNASVDLLHKIELVNKQSRQRTRLVNILKDRIEEVAGQEIELQKEHCGVDGDGNPKTKVIDGVKYLDLIDQDAFLEDKEDLLGEELAIEGENNKVMLETVREALRECQEPWQGEEGDTYGYLCEQFDVDGDED